MSRGARPRRIRTEDGRRVTVLNALKGSIESLPDVLALLLPELELARLHLPVVARAEDRQIPGHGRPAITRGRQVVELEILVRAADHAPVRHRQHVLPDRAGAGLMPAFV